MKSYLFLPFLSCLIMTQAVYSQGGPELDKGDKAFDNFDFQEALYFYGVANEANPNDPKITRKIATTYRRMGQLAVSAEWYSKTIELDGSEPQDMLYYAEALKNLQQYEEAIHYYDMYNKLKPGDSRAMSHLNDTHYYRDLFADTAKYDMKSMKINNENPIIGVTLFEDEKLLVSAVNLERGKQAEVSPFLDVYLCDFNEQNEFVKPIKLDKKVNSKYHDGPAFYSFAEQKLYITRNNIRNGKPVRDKNGNVNLKIYSAEYKNGEWSSAQELKFNDDGYSTGHASLSKDGSTMYFVSTREGGFGGSDLYQCFKTGNNWSEPVNLGPNVNTPGNEMFPFLGEDGFLYFASDGHAGLGGLDVFFSALKSEVWQSPTNLGSPINSSMDDFALVYDKESDNGYFCSNRSGNGDDDLYFYKHIKIDRMIVAGTIRASSPNISLAGERIQIKKLGTGESKIQNLDEYERFEFFASAGEKVEITFMNAEYFDPENAVVTYEIPEILEDPYVNIGISKAQLRKIPSREGVLTEIVAELAKAKAASNNTSENIALQDPTHEKSQNYPALDGRKNNAKANLNDDSTISAQKKAEANKQYQKQIDAANRLFEDKKYSEAKAAFTAAGALNKKETYPSEMIERINKIQQEEAVLATKTKYETQIAIADYLRESKNFADAQKAYQVASTLMPDQAYAKEQITAMTALIEKQKQEAAKTTTNTSHAKETEFDRAVPVIDLVGMSIDNVVFDYNKSFIRKENMPTLDQLAKTMKENPDTKLLIRAHCDSRGSLAYNQSLSMSRAMAVQGYLMQKGINRTRITAEWYGEQRPLNGCIDDVPCEEDQYEINRRAEFKLVAK